MGIMLLSSAQKPRIILLRKLPIIPKIMPLILANNVSL